MEKNKRISLIKQNINKIRTYARAYLMFQASQLWLPYLVIYHLDKNKNLIKMSVFLDFFVKYYRIFFAVLVNFT